MTRSRCRLVTHSAPVLILLWLAFNIGSSAIATPTFANAVTNGIVNFTALTEASGVAASRNNPNVLWTHNDSGHAAQVFAIDTQGRLLGTYSIPGNTDNEDIAIGPGPVTNVLYLYVGDIGDNGLARQHIKVYQIPEPAVYGKQYTNPVTAAAKGARTITLTYPDGTNNAEAMFVDPVTGDLFILTKAATSRIYTASKSQLDTNDAFALTFVRTLSFNVPSGADISPSGNEIIVRQETFASLWTRTNGQSISSAFSGAAISIPVTGTANGEPNGEAIGFDSLGSGYFTLSDNATNQPLRYFARTSADGPPPPPRVLVGPASTWRYLDKGSDQGIAWRSPDFNDDSWNNGAAQFGYGDGDEQTVLSYGANANNKFVTTYFRKNFAAANAADVTNLVAKLVVDDGAVVYLNGNAAIYENLTTAAAYNTLATAMPVALQQTWHSYTINPRLLVEGTNTLAVEIHQSSLTGSNISFDLQLLAQSRNTAYESFDYPPGTSLVGITNAGGQWWTAAGSGAFVASVVSGNLPVVGLAPPVAAAMRFAAVDGPSARFNLVSNITNGTLYYSFAFKVTDLGALAPTGGWIAGFNNSRGTQPNTPTVLGNRILARAVGAGGFNLGLAKNTTNSSDWVWATNIFTTNQTIFLAGSYTFNPNTSTDDVSKLWINPSTYAFGADSAPSATLVASAGADITANQIASFVFLQAGLNNTNQPAAAIVDELRSGATWASVTPVGVLQPTLAITQIGNQILLSWSSNASAFVLQATPAPDAPNLWTNVTAPVTPIGENLAVTNPLSPTSAVFYRLRQ